jgi:hypothetical protein
METAKIVESLRNMAQNSKAANDVFTEFATRQRSKGHLLVDTMFYRMQREGFKYSKEEYADILVALSELGVGTLKFGAKNQVKALTGIRYSLQSIGQAGVGRPKNATLTSWSQRRRFAELPEVEAPVLAVPVPAVKPAEKIIATKYDALRSLAAASSLVRAIVEDTGVSSDTKVKLIQTMLESK